MARLKPGEAAPDFQLPDQHGQTVRLADFAGGKLLVYFYPRANTPGCTRQACSIRDAREELADLGLAVVGISPDVPAKQQKFDDKFNLAFPLLADPDHRVAEA
jgi:thioredoxin-dependent peroxiredoxin